MPNKTVEIEIPFNRLQLWFLLLTWKGGFFLAQEPPYEPGDIIDSFSVNLLPAELDLNLYIIQGEHKPFFLVSMLGPDSDPNIDVIESMDHIVYRFLGQYADTFYTFQIIPVEESAHAQPAD